MHAIESIGPILGIVAFLGLAGLAFLLFQQAREIRRLREWAGRAPERAVEAADAVQATAEAARSNEEGDSEPAAAEAAPGRLRGAAESAVWWVRDRYSAMDRHLPVDGRILLGVIAAGVIAAAVLTSGFGLVGGGKSSDKHSGAARKPMVAVLNGTSVPNLAAQVEKEVVKPAGYDLGPVGNADTSFNATIVMYAKGSRDAAQSLAKAVKPKLGETPTEAITSDIEPKAGKAKLALVLGLDDAGFGG
jgi:LytR cell envelope-related transcriptional attenuator